MKKLNIISAALLVSVSAFAGDFVVIANSSTGASAISKTELKRLFTGKLTDFDGKKVTPINLSDDNAAKVEFAKDVLGQSIADYKQFWVEQKVKGNGVPPMMQQNSKAVKAMVAAIPGAIGYVDKAEVDASVKALDIK